MQHAWIKLPHTWSNTAVTSFHWLRWMVDGISENYCKSVHTVWRWPNRVQIVFTYFKNAATRRQRLSCDCWSSRSKFQQKACRLVHHCFFLHFYFWIKIVSLCSTLCDINKNYFKAASCTLEFCDTSVWQQWHGYLSGTFWQFYLRHGQCWPSSFIPRHPWLCIAD